MKTLRRLLLAAIFCVLLYLIACDVAIYIGMMLVAIIAIEGDD